MKTTRFTQLLVACLVAGLFLLSGAASAYTLSFSPSAQSVGLGSTATVEVRISDLAPEPTSGSPGGLGDYDFEVVYDPTIIMFHTATDAYALGLAIGLGVDSSLSGRLKFSDISLEAPADLLALQSDSMLLLTLDFDSMAFGKSSLMFENINLGDVLGLERTPTAINGSITVVPATVPEPGTLKLLAVAGLIVLARRPLRLAIRAQ